MISLPNNAFWNRTYATYGAGDGTSWRNFAGSLDIVAHEITHGVTESEAGLVYHLQSGALNESFSDVFGVLVDNNDWLIGEDVNISGALRSMENPRLYNQPDHMNNFVVLPDDKDHDWGGVHTNSGIPNKAFYLVAVALNREKAGRIWYRMLANILVSTSQFIDCANAAMQSASELYGSNSQERLAVRNAFRQVGILPNSSPQITSTPSTSATVNTPYSYQMAANDADGDPLTYSLATKPSTMTINSSTGLITWTPSQTNPSVPVTAQVADAFGGSTQQSWTINVGGGVARIAGSVNYYRNTNPPVRDVSMALTGAATRTVITGTDARYEFASLTNGSNYTVTPSKTGGVGNSIGAFDAAQVLQHTVRTITLEANHQEAADVSNDGSVSSFDAANILQFTVGIITSFPAGGWGFVPVSKSYSPLNAELTNENFLGLVYGDVSGNWTADASPAPAKTEHAGAQVALAPPELNDQKQLRAPILVSAAEEISSVLIRLSLDFDHRLLRGIEVAGSKEAGLVAFTNRDQVVTIAAAFAVGKAEQQIDLLFDPAVLGQALHVTALAVNETEAAEMSQPLVLQTQAVLPKEFLLSQNYPNPFNPSTVIEFSLPQAAEVEILVFNVHGQLVKSLQKGSLEAGTHKVEWNGRDENGWQVSNGMFIVEMNAGSFHARRKMIMLK